LDATFGDASSRSSATFGSARRTASSSNSPFSSPTFTSIDFSTANSSILSSTSSTSPRRALAST